MGLFRWFSVVAVAFVLAGMPPALAQGMPDEATRARVADWIERCGRPSDACWPVIKRIEESALGRWCRAIEAYWDTARLVRDPETVLHSIEELRGRREKAKEFLAECVPIFAAALDEAGGGDDGSSDAVYRGPVEPADRVMQAVKRSNLRRGPGTTHDKVGLLAVGDEVRVTGAVGDWLRIEAPAGGEAFVYGPLLAEIRSSSRREVAEAPGRLCADNADDADCWRKIVENPGCHLWVDAARPNRTRVSWSGSCEDGAATGKGTLVTRTRREAADSTTVLEETVTMLRGRRHGKASRGGSAGLITEGEYDNGVPVGRWIMYDSDGLCFSVRELSGGKVVRYDRDCSNYIEPRATDLVAGLPADNAPASGSRETAPRDVVAPSAGTGPLHGSIAFSQDDDGAYAWGIAWSFDSSAGAQAEALGQCREYGGTRCAEAGWFQEACGALAIGDGNGYGTGWGATTGEAERDALAQCRVSNDDCRIEVARCAQSEQAGGAGRTDSEDTAVSREPADTSDDSCGGWEATSNPTWNEEGLRRGGLNIPREHSGGTRAEAEDHAQRTCSGYSNHSEYSLLLVSCVVGEAKCVQPSGQQEAPAHQDAEPEQQVCKNWVATAMLFFSYDPGGGPINSRTTETPRAAEEDAMRTCEQNARDIREETEGRETAHCGEVVEVKCID